MGKYKFKAAVMGVLVALLLSVFWVPALLPALAQGGVTGFSTLRVTNFYRAQPRTALTITMNGSINATGTYQPLTAAGAVSVSGDNLVVEPSGTLLTLVNVGSNTITITETANMVSAGNIALGAGDTATFWSNGSDWYQVAASNN